MKRFLPFIIVAVVGLVTIGAGVMLYRAKRPQTTAIPKAMAASKERGEEVHVRGPANAAVTLEEYGDFQCPPCGGLEAPLQQIERDYASSLRVIFRNFPFTIHEHAHEAAYAAEAAGLQGRFWEMHDLLYENQDRLEDELLVELTQELHLAPAQLQEALETKEFQPRVRADFSGGVRSGVNGTPTFFINGQRHDGAYDFASLVEAIDRVLE